jgi:hypothetical protein
MIKILRRPDVFAKIYTILFELEKLNTELLDVRLAEEQKHYYSSIK